MRRLVPQHRREPDGLELQIWVRPLSPSRPLSSHLFSASLPEVVLTLTASGVRVRDRADVSCLCGPGEFQTDLLACLQQNRSPAEQRDAQKLQGEVCGNLKKSCVSPVLFYVAEGR